MTKLIIKLTVNGKKKKVKTTPSTRLLDLLRGDLHLTGQKKDVGKANVELAQ